MLAAMVDGDGRRDGQPKALTMTDSDGSRFDPFLSSYPVFFVGTWGFGFRSTCEIILSVLMSDGYAHSYARSTLHHW